MILIADSSALVALSICGSLHLLEELFGEVNVGNKAESLELRQFLQGKVKTVDMDKYVYLDAYADAGETEAMLLYKQIKADWLLIDDKRDRKIATVNKIQTIGSLSILLAAKKQGRLSEIKPKLDLLVKSNLFTSDALIKIVLEMAGE